MIKWIHLTAHAKTEEDFNLLTSLLEKLGFRSKERERYPNITIQPFLPSEAGLEVVHRKNARNYADLELTISDPDSAAEVIGAMGLELLEDGSGPEPKNTVRNFKIQLPGGTTIAFTGIRTTMSRIEPGDLKGDLSAKGRAFGIVVSRFNSFITERLLDGVLDGLSRCGIERREDYDIVRVPGAFEIPSAARTLAETGKYDAIICLGCLLRGDTAHYDVIANEVTRGIGQSAQETGIPHAFGVLTCDTLEQAIDRAGLKSGNKGFEAALAAVEMANLKKAVSRQSSVLSKKPRVPRSARNDKLRKTRNEKSQTSTSSSSRQTPRRRPR
jgi:6,7-dimethyl-8-ribityllumazine synthase